MAGEWRIATIGEIAEKVAMGPFGSSIKVETFVPTGVPVISGQHLHGCRLDESPGFNFITREHADRLKNANVQRGDVIFTHAGNIGQVALIPEESRYDSYVISQRQFYMRCKRDYVIPEFIVYYFKTGAGKHKLLANTSQVGVPSIAQPVSYLRTITIPFPPLPEQRAIAHILGTLDDKIELNQQMNETLEAIARAIFKSWFVDFDPVIDNALRAGNPIPPELEHKAARRSGILALAKAEGHDLGLPKHLSDLFPDRFQDSEIGPIPARWKVGTLSDVAIHPRRGIQPSEIEPSTPYIALEHMPRRCIALADWGSASGLDSNKFEFKKGEILFGKLRPYFHKVGVAPLDGVCATDIVVVAPRSDKWFGFVLGHVSSTAFVEYTNAGSIGTKMPRTSWGEMARYVVVLPPELIARAFTDTIRPAIACIIASIYESHTLAALRDTLLPRLISGELRVKDAEQIIGGQA